MPTTAEEIHAAVEQRFAQVARSPKQERKFPVGPASAKKLGYGPQEIDALPPAVTESFCGVGNALGLGEAPAENEQPLSDRTCGERPHVLVHYRRVDAPRNPGQEPGS